MSSMLQQLSQLFPPKPKFTEKDVPILSGKVVIVTGGNTGVGKEVAKIVYEKGAKTYIASRNQSKSLEAIESIKKDVPATSATGQLATISLDLGDLTTIKASVDEFLSKENELHILFNNAGVMYPGNERTRTPQGYEIQIGVNNIGTFMFTKLLTPTLVSTARTSPKDSVRVVWVSSSAAEGLGYKDGGVDLDNMDYKKPMGGLSIYGHSKAGNYLHAVEFAKRFKDEGIISIPLNPGNLKSELYSRWGTITRWFIHHTVLYPVIFGAYTEIFAGFSPSIGMEQSGQWVVNWGRFMPIRKDLLDATKSPSEGGTGHGAKFWEWTEDQVRPYM